MGDALKWLSRFEVGRRALEWTRVWLASAAWLTLAPSYAARAQADEAFPPGVVLHWQAPDGCPDTAQARRALALELRHGGAGRVWPTTRIDARVVTQDAGGHRLELRFSGEREGVRHVQAADCAELDDTAAVLVAVALLDASRTPREPARSAPLPQEPPAPGSEAEPLDSRRQDAAPHTALKVSLGAWFVLDAGTLPAISAGLGASVRLWLGRLHLGVDGAFLPGTETSLDPAGGAAHMDLRLWDIGLHGCWNILRPPLGLAPCLAFSLRGLHGESIAVAEPTQHTELLFVPALGAGLWWQWGKRLLLRADLRVGPPVPRARWTVDDFPVEHQPAPLGARLSLGIELWL